MTTFQNDLKTVWIANFQTIHDLANVRFNRGVVPENAISLDIETINTGDVSSYMQDLRRKTVHFLVSLYSPDPN